MFGDRVTHEDAALMGLGKKVVAWFLFYTYSAPDGAKK